MKYTLFVFKLKRCVLTLRYQLQYCVQNSVKRWPLRSETKSQNENQPKVIMRMHANVKVKPAVYKRNKAISKPVNSLLIEESAF